MSLDCPKCRVAMNPFDQQGVAIDLCPRCKGLWYDRGELQQIAGCELELIDGDQQLLARSTDRNLAAGPALSCPRCRQELAEKAVRGAGSLRIDHCSSCGGLFLDAGELQSLRHLASRRRRHVARQDARLLRDIRAADQERRRLAARQQRSIEVQPAHSSGRNFLIYLLGIPVEEDNTLSRTPYMVYGLLVFIALVWIAQLVAGLQESFTAFGQVPEEILSGQRLYTVLTSVFIHADWFHVLGNLYFLWVFGDNIEDRIGSLPFLGWYLLWGLCGSLLSLALVSPADIGIPHLGASGAIAGAMGAYLVLFPDNRIINRLTGILWFGWTITIPAWGYLVFWVALNLLFGLLELPGVGWWAHLGGFAAGFTVGLVYRWSGRH